MNYQCLIQFPKETLIEIISYLKEKDLWSLSATCKKFYEIGNQIWLNKMDNLGYKNNALASPFQNYLCLTQNEFCRNTAILIDISQNFEFKNIADQIVIFEDLFTYIYYRRDILERNHNKQFRDSLRQYLLNCSFMSGYEFSSKKYFKYIFDEDLEDDETEKNDLGLTSLFSM